MRSHTVVRSLSVLSVVVATYAVVPDFIGTKFQFMQLDVDADEVLSVEVPCLFSRLTSKPPGHHIAGAVSRVCLRSEVRVIQ